MDAILKEESIRGKKNEDFAWGRNKGGYLFRKFIKREFLVLGFIFV